MLEKFEDFMFDIIGLFLPGLVFTIVLLLPLTIFDFSNGINKLVVSNPAGAFLEKYTDSHLILIWVFILVCYLLGHVIKVFSKYPYKIGQILFDDGLNKLLRTLLTAFENSLRSMKKNENFCLLLYLIDEKYRKELSGNSKKHPILDYIVTLVKFTKSIFSDILEFKVESYYKDNEPIKKKVIEKLNKRYTIEFPDKWYSIYKISNVIVTQQGLKTLTFKFLAKYNFYRSLSFIFIFNHFYLIYMFYTYKKSLIVTINTFHLILIINAIFWLTFHDKFKRYWVLCGNETLMSLFNYLCAEKE